MPERAPSISEFRFLGDRVVELTFKTGEQKVVDLEPYLFGPMFDVLLETDLFYDMFIAETGGLAWPNGADMCPVMLYYNLPPSTVDV